MFYLQPASYFNSANYPILVSINRHPPDGISAKDFSSSRIRNSSLLAQAGNLTLIGQITNDRLGGGRGNDYINGGSGNDFLWGRAGNDILVGSSGNDILVGETGGDRLLGGSGNDILGGDNGDDWLDGGTGTDYLSGGNSDDVLTDRDGRDLLIGGRGRDEFRIGDGSLGRTAIADFQPGEDKIKFLKLGIRFNNLKIQDNSLGSIVSYRGKELIQLLGVKAANLTPNSFDLGNPQLAAELQQSLDLSLPSTESPGATAGIVTADGRYWLGASGVSNLELGLAANASDRFNIASVTKTFTGTVIMQLVQERKLTLEDSISKWLPFSIAASIPNSKEITIRQLLSMTSGIYNADPIGDNALSGSYYQELFNNPSLLFQDRTPAEFIAKYVAGREPIFPPGRGFDYNNSNYRLLGLVIESATGKTLAQVYQERIVEPLGLQDTFLAGAKIVPGGYSPSYTDINRDGKLDNAGAASLLYDGASGGLISNVRDLSRFARALFDGELLSPAALKELITGSGIPGLGLGIAYQDLPGLGREYISNGTGFGVQTQLLYLDKTGTATIVITNGDLNVFDTDNPAFSVLQSILATLSTEFPSRSQSASAAPLKKAP